MVLFELNDIIKEKYNNYIKNNSVKISYEEYKLKALNQFSKIFLFYFNNINKKYIDNILYLNNIHIIIYCIDNSFNKKNITSILIYYKTTSLKLDKYYILLLGTHERFRNYGYGKVILHEFIESIKQINRYEKKIKILVKSLERSIKFYYEYGFIQSELKTNKFFYNFETTKELNSNKDKILELNI